jgi:hypothetical protein
MDQGDLDFHVAGKYHAVGPLGVVFVDTFHLPQTRCVVKMKGHTEDLLRYGRWLPETAIVQNPTHNGATAQTKTAKLRSLTGREPPQAVKTCMLLHFRYALQQTSEARISETSQSPM